MSGILARHILCVLGPWTNLDAVRAIVAKSPGFELDEQYSTLQPDPRMADSFEASMDRTAPSFGPADERAIAEHRAVAYVLSPAVRVEQSVAIAESALGLLRQLLVEGGGVAAKIESSGIAHGRERWIELAQAAAGSERAMALYKAFVRRPIYDEDDEVYFSCGMHLLGHRELEVPDGVPALGAVELMDLAARRLLSEPVPDGGVGMTLEHSELGAFTVVDGGGDGRHDEDSFQYNPHGLLGIVPADDED
jgi:hypothetical protein